MTAKSLCVLLLSLGIILSQFQLGRCRPIILGDPCLRLGGLQYIAIADKAIGGTTYE